MTLEKLKQLLAAGQITQAEFDELVKTVKEPEPTEPPKDPEPKPDDSEPSKEPIDYDKLDKIIQARVDKQMAEERRKTAEYKKKLDRLQQDKLTDEELKKLEIENKEKEIAEREQAITDKENRLFAIKAIKEAGRRQRHGSFSCGLCHWRGRNGN